MELNGKDLCRIRQRLIDGEAEIGGINKILNYCSNWADRLELEMDAHKTSKLKNVICAPGSFRGMDVIGEEFAIIEEMVGYCNKRIGELQDELNDIRGQLLSYNYGEYIDTAKRITEERIKRDFE